MAVLYTLSALSRRTGSISATRVSGFIRLSGGRQANSPHYPTAGVSFIVAASAMSNYPAMSTSTTKKMTVHEITNAAQLQQLIDQAASKLVVIDFKAAWCGPCKMIAPFFHELAESHKDVVFASVDVDNVPDAAAKYDVEAMPTFVYVKNGKEISNARLTGASKDKLLANVKANK